MYRVLCDPSVGRIRNPAQRQARRGHLRRRDAGDGRLRLLPQGQGRHAEAAGHPDDGVLLRQGSHPEALTPARPRGRAIQEASKSRQATRDAIAVAPKSIHRKSRSQGSRNSSKIRGAYRTRSKANRAVLIVPLPPGEVATSLRGAGEGVRIEMNACALTRPPT